jgi:imidazolonepropionase-like amidohydrolase
VKSGTVSVGEYFVNEDDFGTVEPGKRADLILVTGNPLDDAANIAQPAGVMVSGRWLSRDVIDEKLRQIAGRYER